MYCTNECTSFTLVESCVRNSSGPQEVFLDPDPTHCNRAVYVSLNTDANPNPNWV